MIKEELVRISVYSAALLDLQNRIEAASAKKPEELTLEIVRELYDARDILRRKYKH